MGLITISVFVGLFLWGLKGEWEETNLADKIARDGDYFGFRSECDCKEKKKK